MSAQVNFLPNFGKNKGEEEIASNNQVEDMGCDEDEVASEHSSGSNANERYLQINPSLGLINLPSTGIISGECLIHQKPYQAFCEEDFQMTCLECIIEDGSLH